MPHNLHFYTHYSKEKIKVTNKALASGGEGQLYTIATPRVYKHLVAKLYFPDKRTEERLEKMHYLIQHPPFELNPKQEASIAWVVDILYHEKKFVGILMRRIKGEKLTQLTLNKLPRRANKVWQRFAFGQKDALKLRMHTCFNIAAVLHRIHSSGRYVLVDLKPDNVMIQPNGLVAMVDLDSTEVVEAGNLLYPAPVATPEYTPPEHYHEKRTIIEESWDYFSLGVMFYQLLLGLHPFTASAKPPHDGLVSLHDKVKHHLYVHHSAKQDSFAIIPPPHKKFYDLPDALQLLFKQCFETGSVAPTFRPSAQDWCIALAKILKLPFKAMPSNKIALSELYFNVYDIIDWKTFDEQQIPELDHQLVRIIDLPTEFAPSIPSYLNNVQYFKNAVEERYSNIIDQKRSDLINALLVIFAISGFFFLVSPWLLILSVFYLFPVFHESIFKVRQQSLMNTIDPFITFDLLDLKQRTITAKNKALAAKDKIEARIRKANQHLQKIKPEDLTFLKTYAADLQTLHQSIDAFKELKKSTKTTLAQTRQLEITAYQDLLSDFQKKLTYKLSSYDAKGFERHIGILEKQIEEKAAFLSKDKHPSYLRLLTKQQYELKGLEDQQANELVALWNEQEANIVQRIDLFRKQSSRQNRKREYQQFTQKTEQLLSNIKMQTSLMQLDKDVSLKFGITVSEANEYIDFYKEVVNIKSTQQIIAPFLEQYAATVERLEQQAIQADHLETIKEFLAHIKVEPLSAETTDLPELINKYQAYNHQKDLVTKQLTKLGEVLNKLADDPNILNDKMDVAYWFSDFANLFKLLEQSLHHYHKFTTTFYQHPYLAFIREKDAKQQAVLQKLKQQYPKAVADLEEEFAEAIAYKENPRMYDKQRDRRIKEHKTVLQQEAKAAFELIKADQNLVHQQALQALKQEHKEAQQALQKEIKKGNPSLQKQIDKLKMSIKQVKEEQQMFETALAQIKGNIEATYQSAKDTLIEQFNDLEKQLTTIQNKTNHANQLMERYKNVEPLLAEEVKQYKLSLQDLAVYDTEHIRLDILNQWKKQFQPKIAVKNLLVGGTQSIKIKPQLKEDQDKEE